MELKAINPDAIPSKRAVYGKTNTILKAFIESEAEALELVGWQDSYNTWRSAYTAIRNSAKASNMDVTVLKRGERLFLIKKEK